MTGKKQTILAIDDDITQLNTIQTILEGFFEVSLAKNTNIAKTILKAASPDLILLDMNMPDSSGLDFLDYLRNEESSYHIPVIIVSSQGTADVIDELRKRGIFSFVVKPISPKILLDKIDSSLKSARIRIEKDPLKRRLEKLISSCASGKGSAIEEHVKYLEHIFFQKEIDDDIAAINKTARDMEYNLVEEMVRQLIVKLNRMN